MTQAIKQGRRVSISTETKNKEIEARLNNSLVRKVRELRKIIDDPSTPPTYRQVYYFKGVLYQRFFQALSNVFDDADYSAGAGGFVKSRDLISEKIMELNSPPDGNDKGYKLVNTTAPIRPVESGV